jgi:hypothetical protein
VPELTDLEAGRCLVLLGDGETWDTVEDCEVRFVTEEQDAAREWGDPIYGYRYIRVEELVRHYLQTKVLT